MLPRKVECTGVLGFHAKDVLLALATGHMVILCFIGDNSDGNGVSTEIQEGQPLYNNINGGQDLMTDHINRLNSASEAKQS